MPNTNSKFNPAYSTVKSIFLQSGITAEENTKLDILKQNTQCRFERLETVENVNDVLPSGSVLVTDFKDIVSFIGYNKITNIVIEFFNGKKWECDITSVSYANNAASDTEETFVQIHFTNSYYTYFSSNLLTNLLGYKKPNVFSVNELVGLMQTWVFGSTGGYQDLAKNYFLYKPYIPYNDREEALADNAIEFMNYLSTGAIDSENNPNFLFWTSFGGAVNFKSFKRDLTKDSSYATLKNDYRNIAVFDGDSVLQKVSDKDDTKYRKAYFVATNPAYQWISKNYYYIRKTPKYLDSNLLAVAAGLTGTTLANAIKASNNNLIKNLTYQFQDDGQKYNIDVITVNGRGQTAPPGGDCLHPESSWGYYDGENPTNNNSVTNLISNQYGTNEPYRKLNLGGMTGFMPFLDSPDMWKNMFDITPIHPHYPDDKTVGLTFSGARTHLQKVMDIRYNTFMGLSGPSGASIGLTAADLRLKQVREIEAQNFVVYSLCCLGKKENCFFAVLQRYEPDSAYYTAGVSGPTGSTSGITYSAGPTLLSGAKFYRYKWNKLIFSDGSSGPTGASGSTGGYSGTGPTGTTFQSHQIEKWSIDPTVKSSEVQDKTWAINLNERGLTTSYLPPGWVQSSLPNFKFRPIGATASGAFSNSSDIFHIARVCIEQVDAENSVTYFWVENVVDGNC